MIEKLLLALMVLIPEFVQTRHLAISNSSDVRTDVTEGRLYKLNNVPLDQQMFAQLNSYAIRCCVKKNGAGHGCENRLLGYWAWIPQRIFGGDNSQILTYLDTNFNPDKVENEDICITYYAEPIKGIQNHVENQMLPRMRAQSATLYGEGELSEFLLFTAKSPCYTNSDYKQSCLNLIFGNTKLIVFNGEGTSWVQGKMHTLNVGFNEWFNPTNQDLTQIRNYFCGNMVNVNTGIIKGVDYYKLTEVDPDWKRYNFYNALTFNKLTEEEPGDQEHEDELSR